MIKSEQVNNGIRKLHFLGYYFPVELGQDDTSKALLYFKQGITDYVEVWSNQTKKFSGNYDYVIRNLRSTELESKNDKQEDYICNTLLYNNESKYYYNLLKKNSQTSQLKTQKSLKARLKLLNAIYTINNAVDLNNKRILIFDDVYTTGASMLAIASEIKNKYPNAIMDGFVLCKTVHNKNLYNNNEIENNFHIRPFYELRYPSPPFANRGFIKRRTNFFPQKWTFDAFRSIAGIHRIKIFLKESKEVFILDTWNFKEGLKHTPFVTEELDEQSNPLTLWVEKDDTYLGCCRGRLYLIPLGYEKQYYTQVHSNCFEFSSTVQY